MFVSLILDHVLTVGSRVLFKNSLYDLNSLLIVEEQGKVLS